MATPTDRISEEQQEWWLAQIREADIDIELLEPLIETVLRGGRPEHPDLPLFAPLPLEAGMTTRREWR